LLLLSAWTLLAFGGFLREMLDRRRSLRRWRGRGGDPVDVRLAAWTAAGPWPGLLGVFASRATGVTAARLPAVLDGCELLAERMLARFQLVGRAGPTLGLMATLLPMGPALLALADDDVAMLSRSLAVAFTATITGLLVGLLGAVMGSVRRHWYAADLQALEHLVDDPGEVAR
jgi:hypothetical protein